MLGARLFGSATPFALGVKVFLPIWLAAAALNLWVGVSRAGYSVGEEFPIFLVIFLLPAVVGAFVWWKYS